MKYINSRAKELTVMALRKGHLKSVEPTVDHKALQKQAEGILRRFAGVFEGDGIRVVNPSDCARSLLFRAGQSQNQPLFEALRQEICGALMAGKLVAEEHHYRRTHKEKGRKARGRGSGDLKSIR